MTGPNNEVARKGVGSCGVALISAAVALSVATWIGSDLWLAARDPVPHQGAMVIAFFVCVGSVVPAAALLGFGIRLLRRGGEPSSRD